MDYSIPNPLNHTRHRDFSKRFAHSRGRKGYRPIVEPDYPDRFWKNLKTKKLGHSFYYFMEVTSTNDVAAELIQKGAPEGTLVMAEAQSRGRGRQGRKWTTSQGQALAFSLVLKPKIEARHFSGITLAAAVAVAKTLEGYGLKPQIKWPNDLLLKGKKVCGILTEMGPSQGKIRTVILGVGINLHQGAKDFPPEIRKNATSVYQASGQLVERVDFLQKLMKQLEIVDGWMKRKKFHQVLKEWQKRSIILAQRVRVIHGVKKIEGQVIGVDERGFLLVRGENDRMETIFSGDIQILPSQTKKRDS